MADDSEYPRKNYRLGKKEVERVNDPAAFGSQDPNDVRATLRGNMTGADKAGLNANPPTRRRRLRRRRDYIIAMVAGNLLLFLATLIAPVIGLAGLVIFDVGITWIMWFVIDDY